MKKFYFFLVAMVLGVSANAVDYTLIGEGTSIKWDTSKTDLKFTKVSDTEYVLDYQGTLTSGFKVKSLENSWNDAMNWGSSNSDTNKLTIGETFKLTNGSASKNISIADGLTATNPHIVFNPVAETLLITTSQVSEATVTYALWGNLPNAASDWSRTELDDAGNDIWSIEGLEITLASNFGIQYLEDGNQTKWIYATDNAVISGEGGNYACGIEGEADGVNFTINPGVWDLSFNAKSMTLTAKKTGASEVEISYRLWGNIADNGGLAWDAIEMTNTSGNVWTASNVTVTANSEFGIQPLEDGAYNSGWLASPEAVLISGNGTYPVTNNNTKNFGIVAGTYTIAFDADAMTLNVTRDGGDAPAPELPATLYIIGNAAGTLPTGGWDPSKGIADNTAEDGVYTWNSVDMKDAGDGNSYFSLVTALGADWDADVNSSNRYGSVANDALVTPNEAAEIVLFQAGINASSATSWKIAAGTYKIVADLNNMTLTATQTNSVAAIEAAEDVAPVYYNLQGVRVNAPANGLYIVVRGDKVAKELVK